MKSVAIWWVSVVLCLVSYRLYQIGEALRDLLVLLS